MLHEALVTTITLNLPADHPAYRGHFPGRPVLPGVVLLDHVILALEAAGHGGCRDWEISQVKFLSAVAPGDALRLEHDFLPDGSARFSIHVLDRKVAAGILIPTRPAITPHGNKG
jgi:3-hydroxyacyl-[acyl-carrier-protein] dehydratase